LTLLTTWLEFENFEIENFNFMFYRHRHGNLNAEI